MMMDPIVILDAGPLWLAVKTPGKPIADWFRNQLREWEDHGALIVIPEIAS